MASVPPPPPRELRVGTIIDNTFKVLDRCTVPAVAYLAVFTVINGALAYYAPSTAAVKAQLIGALLKFVVGVVGGFLLIDTMARRTGLRTRTDNEAFLPYLLMLVPYTLGVMLGLIVFILPGLIIMARWSIAQPLLVARGDGPMQALGESWELTKGNEFQILLSVLVLLILPIAIVLTCSAFFEKTDVMGIAVAQLATSAMTVVLTAMNLGLYALIVVARNVVASSG